MKALRTAYKAARGGGSGQRGMRPVPYNPPTEKIAEIVQSVTKNIKVSLRREYTFDILDNNTIRIGSNFQRWNYVIAVQKGDLIKYCYEIGGAEYGSKISGSDEHIITPEVESEVRRLFRAQSLT